MSEIYEGVWRELIQPQRFAYSIEDLGPQHDNIDGVDVFREDFQVENAEGHLLECSLFRPTSMPQQPVDVVVYLHARGGGRIEALFLKRVFLPSKPVLVFDYAGSGTSQGKYITLGLKEARDAHRVIERVQERVAVRSFAFWGRSMGAVAAILLAEKLQPSRMVACLVLDSPFSSFRGMVYDVIYAQTRVPKCSIDMILSCVMGTVKKKTEVRLDKIEPLKTISHVDVPAFFFVGLHDIIARPDRVKDLYLSLRCRQKEFHVIPGEHASSRSANVINAAVVFMLRCFEQRNACAASSQSTI